MALADLPAPLSTYEVRVIGNRVVSGASDSYIAGLVSVSQQTPNAGQGYINFIDYANGEMRVGGAVGSSTTGARVRINDPVLPSLGTGRYSKGLSPDVRFTSDQDNPTIRTETGFPMCLPRVAPTPAQADLRCPERNRPKDALGIFQTIFTFPAPAAVVPGGADPRLQMPFEVGDYISFAGTLVTDNLATPTVGPYPGTAATYVSAHTIVANLGVYTAPGADPAYLAVDVTLLGVGGISIAGVAAATVRTSFEGFSTDPTRNVHLFGIDVDCATGATTDRDWGSVTVDQGAAAGGAVKGRWRFIPPSKVLTINPSGFLTTVTLVPPPDVVTITGVEYRIGKQRLTITATSSVVSPTIDLILQTFNVPGGTRPGGALTNLGGGAYSIALVGVPQPSGAVTVTSTAGGSATSPVTRLRP